MNKAELVEQVARQTGLAKRACKETVDAVVSTIADSLAKREKITLVGFGSFKVITRKSRRGRNPQTGEEIQIPTKEVPKFAPGKSLKEAVL
jgi:DNA-binding protein HU-beta